MSASFPAWRGDSRTSCPRSVWRRGFRSAKTATSQNRPRAGEAVADGADFFETPTRQPKPLDKHTNPFSLCLSMKIKNFTLRFLVPIFLIFSANAQPVSLNQYPLLSQKDPANYRDQSFLTLEDSLPDGAGKALVPNLACAATVYTMLERGHGNSAATIDDFYLDPRKFNGKNPGAKRPTYVGSDISFDSQQIISALKSGQPVVLHGFGGPLKEHFVLAVGFKMDDSGKQVLTALDPYPGRDSDKPGKQIEINLSTAPPAHPTYSEIVFQKMRLVAGENSVGSDLLATTADKYNVTMNDGTVFVGAIQIKKVAFDASYGATEVTLGDIVSFSGGFLALTDGSKLKGQFSVGNLTLETSRGKMNLPFASIATIAKQSALVSAATASSVSSRPSISPSGNDANLTGKVFDCFGKPLAGVHIEIANSRFSATTDAGGNYSLGYIPGKIQMSFKKIGFYDENLTLEISALAIYPVKDVSIYKEVSSEGIFFAGDNGYVGSENSIQVKSVEARKFSFNGVSSEGQYFVSGPAVSIDNFQGDLKFVINFRNWSERKIVLFRVQPGAPFVRKVIYGITDTKLIGDQLDVGSFSQVENLQVWVGHLDPGYYVFVNQMAPGMPMMTGFIDPCFYFRIGNGAGVSSERAIANPSGSIPISENTSSPTEPQTPFEKLAATVPNANLFNNHTREFTFSYDQVWGAVSSLIAAQKEKVIQSDKDKGVLMTDVTRHGIIGFPSYDRYCLLFEKVDESSTKVTIKLLKYYMDFEGQHGPPKTLEPQSDKIASSKAEAFLDKVNKQLNGGK